MNLRIYLVRVSEDSRVTQKASRERIPKRSHKLVYMRNYRYKKCTRLKVQGRELEGVGSESNQNRPS